jgi:hypothetical protein
MQRTQLLPFLLLLPSLAMAQSFNGSFEGAGTGDISGWTGFCWEPFAAASNCPGGGDWGLVVESGHNTGCTNAMVIHKLPDVVDGSALTLNGWCTRYFGSGTQFIGFGLGTVNNGAYTYNTFPQSNFSGWQFFTVTQTVELGPGDTAMVFLQPGSVNFPLVTSLVMFDELVLTDVTTGVQERTGALAHRYDPALRRIHLVSPMPVSAVDVFDAQGRRLHAPVEHRVSGEVVVDASALPPGLVLVQVLGPRGMQWARVMAY